MCVQKAASKAAGLGRADSRPNPRVCVCLPSPFLLCSLSPRDCFLSGTRGVRETQQIVISFSIAATCAQISPADSNWMHLQFLKRLGPCRASRGSHLCGLLVSSHGPIVPSECVRAGRGQGAATEGEREEGVTHRGPLSPGSALKQAQPEIEEEMEEGGGLSWVPV